MPNLVLDALGERAHAARNAARTGRYQLLLGAGVSLGAVNGRGNPIPGTRDLVDKLSIRFPNAHIDSETSLPRAYQRAVTDADTDRVWKFLRDVFGGATHHEWFVRLSGLPWRRVWTLNIDDAYERSYTESTRQKYVPLRVVNWTDDYAESGDAELIHLHGSIATTNPSPLVFSLSEYHGSATARPVWHQVFRGIASTEPLIILGASILNDTDVEALVLASRPSNIAPSIIVDPFISAGNAWELERSGYTIIRASAEHFVEAWEEAFDLAADQLAALYSAVGVNLPQMTILEPAHLPAESPSHDYLGGSEPTWNDARRGLVAEFDWMKHVLQNVSRWAEGRLDRTFVQVVVAARLAGASSGAMLIANHAAALNATVLWFDRSTRFNPEQVIDFCIERGPVILVIDGGHRFAQDTDRMAALASAEDDVSLFVLLLDRTSHFELIEDQLVGAYSKQATKVTLPRSGSDAQAIVALLQEHGRLGSLEAKPAAERIEHFKGRDIFSAMGEVEHAPGFRLRFDREVQQLEEPWQQDLVFLLALASISGAIVGIQEASFAVGIRVQVIIAAIDSDTHLSALVETNGELLRPRQRDRGIESLRAANRYNFLDRLASMLVELAPLDTRSSHRRNNRAAALVGQLMGAKLLRQVFPDSDLQTFYDLLRSSYGSWNARYWEQRAIDARMSDDLPQAESYAERAVTILDDAFTRTTLATVLMYRATAMAKEGDPLWEAYYDRAYSEFDIAINKNGGHVASFALLQSAIRVLTIHAERTRRSLQARDAFDKVGADWSTAYAILRIGLRHEDGFDSVNRAESLARQFDAVTAGLRSEGLAGLGAGERPHAPASGIAAHDVEGAEGVPHSEAAELEAVIRLIVGRLDSPTPLTVVANRVKSELKSAEQGWAGHRSFTAALRASVENVQIRWQNNRGTVMPPGSRNGSTRRTG